MSAAECNKTRKIDYLFSDEGMIMVSTASVFLPVYITALVLLIYSVYIIINGEKRKKIFVHKGSLQLLPFFALAVIIPAVYGNYIGIAYGIGLGLILILGLYMRTVMTRPLFERSLIVACALSMTSTIVALFEILAKLIQKNPATYRCQSVFGNQNYFGTITATVILICAYKVIVLRGSKRIYYACAAVNFVGMALSGSIFAFVEVFVGVAVLLLFARKHKMLIIFLGLAILGVSAIFIWPELAPRIAYADGTFRQRVRVWQICVDEFKRTPLFGRGGLTYYFVREAHAKFVHTYHAHNMLLDPLLNFGIVGTVMLACYFVRYYARLFRMYKERINTSVSALIIAATAAACAHGLVDITFVSPQTGFLLLLIFSGIGIIEKHEDRKKAG